MTAASGRQWEEAVTLEWETEGIFMKIPGLCSHLLHQAVNEIYWYVLYIYLHFQSNAFFFFFFPRIKLLRLVVERNPFNIISVILS